ncbi:hypothetical protein I551_2770 [Mycobacterium ulcerans str. Harvey]|uniref:Recombination factor protein RarA n=1 Tax=Mycobacterium ulcerans str. Harvey TaxID=1299332 RepID=A0ABP3AKR5_MYCUL|nr:hypothetical protein I551_2770 [Mycobacterium ulcerans str. Harvey]
MSEPVSDGLFDLPGAPQHSDHALEVSAGAPLAVRMRPESLDEVVGQGHLLAPGRRCAGWWKAPASPR